MIRLAEQLSSTIDYINKIIGRYTAWLILGIVLVQFLIVVMRYIFGIGSIFVQEMIIYQHAIVIMLSAGFTLFVDGHVRLDIFYRVASMRIKSIINITGVICFLFPMCIVIWVYSWPYVFQSWRVLEGSKETSGIPAVFMLKTTVLIFAKLLFLQGISLLIKSFSQISNKSIIQPKNDINRH